MFHFYFFGNQTVTAMLYCGMYCILWQFYYCIKNVHLVIIWFYPQIASRRKTCKLRQKISAMISYAMCCSQWQYNDSVKIIGSSKVFHQIKLLYFDHYYFSHLQSYCGIQKNNNILVILVTKTLL